MIAAVIVLAVIAAALGGYIGVDVMRSRRAVPVPAAQQREEPQVFEKTSEQTEQRQQQPEKAEPEEHTEPEEPTKPKYIVIKYSRSFESKLIQSDEQTKKYYSELKNALLALDGVRSKLSWKCESYRKGRATIAKLKLRGKSLCLYLALDPKAFEGTKYKVRDVSEVKSVQATPTMYKVKTDRRLKYAKELIQKLNIPQTERESVDYANKYPYEKDEPLIRRKLIKVLTDAEAQSGETFKPSEVRTEVKASEVDEIMTDEVAVGLIERAESKADRSKQGIINIDRLAQYFENGEEVTLDEIKKRVKGFRNVTYLKVLARGTLNKALTVKADSFSLQAVKMILLTGGKVIKSE